MLISIIIPYYKETDVLARYKKIFDKLDSNFRVYLVLVSGCKVDTEFYSGSNYEIHKVVGGEDAYYTECINFGLELLEDRGVQSEIICFANSDLDLGAKTLISLVSNFHDQSIDCVRPMIKDFRNNLVDYPKRFLIFSLHLTRMVKTNFASFDLSGFRLICFRAELLKNTRLSEELPQYGSDYELLVRLKRQKPSMKTILDTRCSFSADLSPTGRKIDSTLNLSLLVTSVNDVRSPLNYKYLLTYLRKIEIPFPRVLISTIFLKAVLVAFLNVLRRK